MLVNKKLLFIGALILGIFVVIVILLFRPTRLGTSLPSTLPTPTGSPTRSSLDSDKEVDHTVADTIFADIEMQKPWLLSIPIKTREYYIQYDYARGVIKATIYLSSSTLESQAEKRSDLETKVRARLSGLRADLAKEKIEWIIQ